MRRYLNIHAVTGKFYRYANAVYVEIDRRQAFECSEATFDYGRSGVILPFADPRAYTDRLNELFTSSGWTREYTISTVPSLCRMERGKAIVTSKVLVATAVTITRLGSHTAPAKSGRTAKTPSRRRTPMHLSGRATVLGWAATSTASGKRAV